MRGRICIDYVAPFLFTDISMSRLEREKFELYLVSVTSSFTTAVPQFFLICKLGRLFKSYVLRIQCEAYAIHVSFKKKTGVAG